MKVLVAIDQSEFWPQIISSLAKRTWLPDTQFRILTVIEPLLFRWDELSQPDWQLLADEVLEKRCGKAEKILAEARQRLQQEVTDCIVHTEIRHGQAREEVMSAAIDWMPDKVILGAHGRSPNRLFPGAVSHTVARQAPCSVELVRLFDPSEPTPARASNVKQEKAFSGT